MALQNCSDRFVPLILPPFVPDLDLRFGIRPPGVEPELDGGEDGFEGPPPPVMRQRVNEDDNGDIDERATGNEDGADPRFRERHPPTKRARFESFGPGDQAQWWAQNFAEDVVEAPATSEPVASAAPESTTSFSNYPAVAPQWRLGYPPPTAPTLPPGLNFQTFQRGHFRGRPPFPGNRGGFHRF